MRNEVPNQSGSSRQGCREFDARLAAYLEGEATPQVTEHARSCPYCAAVLADLELIRTESRSLAVDPPALVWANIRATLAAEGLIREPQPRLLGFLPFPSFSRMAAPASALAVMAVMSLVLLMPPRGLDHSATSAWLTQSDRDSMAAQIFKSEDDELASTVSELEKSFTARQASLSPAVKAAYRAGLDSLDESIRECRESVGREPSNTLAREYLVSAYSQKAELLAAALQYDVP